MLQGIKDNEKNLQFTVSDLQKFHLDTRWGKGLKLGLTRSAFKTSYNCHKTIINFK